MRTSMKAPQSARTAEEKAAEKQRKAQNKAKAKKFVEMEGAARREAAQDILWMQDYIVGGPYGTVNPRRKSETVRLAEDYLPPEGYDDITEERAAAGVCGHLICKKAPQDFNPDKVWKVLKSSRDVVQANEFSKYCSKECFLASRDFRCTLTDDGTIFRDIEGLKIWRARAEGGATFDCFLLKKALPPVREAKTVKVQFTADPNGPAEKIAPKKTEPSLKSAPLQKAEQAPSAAAPKSAASPILRQAAGEGLAAVPEESAVQQDVEKKKALPKKPGAIRQINAAKRAAEKRLAGEEEPTKTEDSADPAPQSEVSESEVSELEVDTGFYDSDTDDDLGDAKRTGALADVDKAKKPPEDPQGLSAFGELMFILDSWITDRTIHWVHKRRAISNKILGPGLELNDDRERWMYPEVAAEEMSQQGGSLPVFHADEQRREVVCDLLISKLPRDLRDPAGEHGIGDIASLIIDAVSTFRLTRSIPCIEAAKCRVAALLLIASIYERMWPRFEAVCEEAGLDATQQEVIKGLLNQ